MKYASLEDHQQLYDWVQKISGDLAQVRASVETVRALERGLAARIARLEQVDEPEKEKTDG